MRIRTKEPQRTYGITAQDIKIDKGIPCPPRGQHKASKYPWEDMKVGDSFLFPKHLGRQACYQSGAYHNNKAGVKKFVIRRTPEGYRCWRLS